MHIRSAIGIGYRFYEHILRERIKLKKELRAVDIDEKTKLKIEERIKQIVAQTK